MTRKAANGPEEGTTPPDDIDALMTGTFGDGANYKIELSRVSGQSGSAGAFLDAITMEELPEIKTRARDEYGTGTYLVRVLRNGRYHSQARFSVEGRAKTPFADPKPLPNQAPAQGDPLLANVIDRMMQRFEDSQKAILTALTEIRSKPPGGDPFEQFQRIAAIIKETRADSPQIGAQQLMEVWKQGVEAARVQFELAGGGGKSSGGGMLEFAARFFESPMGAALGQGIVQLANLKTPPAHNGAGSGGGGVAAAREAPRQLPPAAHPDPDTAFAQAIAYLVNRAETNSSPALQAEWLYDLISEEGRAWLIETPNILDSLIVQFPAIAPRREWFTQLLEEFRKYAQDDVGGEGAKAESGNSTDGIGEHP